MAGRLRLLVLCGYDPASTFSYHTAWPRHFAQHPAFDCTIVNLADRGVAARVRAIGVAALGQFDAIVLLHSVFSNAQLLQGRLLDRIRAADALKVFFIGNEYKLMPEKMAFAADLGIRLLVTQSSAPEVQRLYAARLGCAVAGIPNTGLDPDLFQARQPRDARPLDLGYRADDAPWYIGHRERREIAEYFAAAAARYGVTVDISLDPADRFIETEWAAFLNRCKGQLGTEAGGDYFELDDRTRLGVNAYVEAHPEATFDDVHARFFASYGPSVPIRIMSGRQVEAAGTRTVQVLFEGRYDGYLQPDVHYIPLRKDFADADDAMRKFRDAAFCEGLVDAAEAMAREQLTYPALLRRFEGELRQVI